VDAIAVIVSKVHGTFAKQPGEFCLILLLRFVGHEIC
jgi:hypothetical protein